MLAIGLSALPVDGRYIYVAWHEEIGVIWILDVATEEERR
jgi:hypothetical protein